MADEFIEIPMTYFIDWFWRQSSSTQELWDKEPDRLMEIFLKETNNGALDLDAVRNGGLDSSSVDSD